MNEYTVRPSFGGDVTILRIPPDVFCIGVSILLLAFLIVTLLIALRENTTSDRKLLNVLIILLLPVIGPILYYVIRSTQTDKKLY